MSRRQRGLRAFTLVELLVVIAIIGVLVALLLPAIQAAREAARRSQCLNNLKQMGLALLNHESAKGNFPRGRWNIVPGDNSKHDVADRPGGKSHDQSWQTQALPYAEQQNIASQYTIKKPWFDAANRIPVSTPLEIFRCPTVPASERFDDAFTTPLKPAAGDYGCANAVGSAVWNTIPDFGTYPGEDDERVVGVMNKAMNLPPAKVKHITDGTSSTLLVCETAGRPELYTKGQPGNLSGVAVAVNVGSGWADPDSGFTPNRLPMINYQNDNEIYSFHNGGAQFVFADGHTKFINDAIDTPVVIALITRAGDELVPAEAL